MWSVAGDQFTHPLDEFVDVRAKRLEVHRRRATAVVSLPPIVIQRPQKPSHGSRGLTLQDEMLAELLSDVAVRGRVLTPGVEGGLGPVERSIIEPIQHAGVRAIAFQQHAGVREGVMGPFELLVRFLEWTLIQR